MLRTPTLLQLRPGDDQFIVDTARKILGSSVVAATNARTMSSAYGIDPKRVDALIPWGNVTVEVHGYVFKKVEADPETPDNFGLFVRLKGTNS